MNYYWKCSQCGGKFTESIKSLFYNGIVCFPCWHYLYERDHPHKNPIQNIDGIEVGQTVMWSA